jgi:hypothetical protein
VELIMTMMAVMMMAIMIMMMITVMVVKASKVMVRVLNERDELVQWE